MTLPNFLYIGAAKAGSTWMYQILRQHPEIFVPSAKDIYYFDKNYRRGLRWYCSFFKSAHGERAVGELSHDYYLERSTAERIHRDLPEARLICCLRDPLDWAVSAYRFNGDRTRARAGLHWAFDTSCVTFGEYVRQTVTLRQIQYAARLAPFLDLFPRRQILVCFYDDLRDDPVRFVETLYRFVGVNPNFRPPSLHTRINVAHEPRLERLAQAGYRVARALRAVGADNVIGAIKHHPLTERILYRSPISPLRIDQESLIWLRTTLVHDLATLQEMLGRSLPPGWLKAEEILGS